MAGNSGSLNLNEEIARLAEELQQLQAAGQSAAESTQPHSRSSADSSALSIGSTVLDIFGAGLGLSPLILGMDRLFSGGEDSKTRTLTRFALPPAIQVNGGVNETGGQAFAVDYPQGGLPRTVPAPVQMNAPAQITVQVQAMDSRSFLDHSADIAMAVRQAMLESSMLNDVVREV
jgi:hypothetical protein